MTQEQSQTGGQRHRARGYEVARMVLAALLIVLVAAGLRGVLPSLGFDGPDAHDELPIAAGLEALIAGLLVIVAVRRARARNDNSLGARLREVLAKTLGICTLVIPVFYLLTRNIHIHLRSNPALRRLTSRGRLHPFAVPPGAQAGKSAGVITYLLVIVVLAAVVLACAILMRRRLRLRQRGRAPAARWTAILDDGDNADELREAVEYGWLALRELDDARGAIIACYLAMEQSLARAGAPRGVAETPDELLARAASTGIIDRDAGARLTAAFYEARFSTRPLTSAHRQAAERALADLAASFGQLAGAAGTGGAGGTGGTGTGTGGTDGTSGTGT